jgi:hypothetical protein
MGEERSIYRVLVKRPEGMRQPEDQSTKWNGGIILKWI